jgi:hypothetical protein
MCIYYLRLLIGIIEEREFEERTKDFFFTFLFKTRTGKKGKKTDTTDINTRYDKKKRTKESRKERETKERKEIKR